jgi:hypothetical protein
MTQETDGTSFGLRLALKFLSLPYHNQLMVASSLQLVQQGDENLTDQEFRKLVFRRAGQEGKQEKLLSMVNMMLDD